jgi:hypothetical protein
MNAQLASELRDGILQQMLQLVDTLNWIGQARIPVEQTFEELNNKRQLEQEGDEDLGPPGAVGRSGCERCDSGSGSRGALAGSAGSDGSAGLRQQNDDANEQVRRLTAKLQDALSGGYELGRIEGLFWS